MRAAMAEQKMITGGETGWISQLLKRSQVFEPDELLAHVAAAQQGSEAAKQLVLDGMALLVLSRARFYWTKWSSFLPDHASFEDVFAGGVAGLWLSLDRFDSSRGWRFTTYSEWHIRNGVQEVVHDLAGSGSIRAKILPGIDLRTGEHSGLVGSNMAGGEWAIDTRPDQAAETEAFDIHLVGQIYELLSTVDSRMPAIARMLEEEQPYRVIAQAVGMTESQVKRLTARARETIEAAGLR